MQHLKAWRLYAGYHTITEFAAATGLRPGWLSELESPTKTKSPLLTTARTLVDALNARLAQPITSDDLLHAPPPNPAHKPLLPETAQQPQEVAPCPAAS